MSPLESVTMQYPPLRRQDILDCREIIFPNRRETQYPQLLRLCMDFELVVLELPQRAFNHITNRFLQDNKAFVLTNLDYRNNGMVFSPWFNTMDELEEFAKKNHVDILHDHLFGDITTRIRR